MDTVKDIQFGIIVSVILTNTVDEEVVLVDIHLYARCSSIEVEQGLCTVL